MINNTIEWVVTEVRQDEKEPARIDTVTTNWRAFTPLFDYMLRSALASTDGEFILAHVADRLGIEINSWKYKE